MTRWSFDPSLSTKVDSIENKFGKLKLRLETFHDEISKNLHDPILESQRE